MNQVSSLKLNVHRLKDINHQSRQNLRYFIRSKMLNSGKIFVLKSGTVNVKLSQNQNVHLGKYLVTQLEESLFLHRFPSSFFDTGSTSSPRLFPESVWESGSGRYTRQNPLRGGRGGGDKQVNTNLGLQGKQVTRSYLNCKQAEQHYHIK